jgi:DnaJ domain
VAELVRGSVEDRPWGRTFATFGLRAISGQLTLVADGKRYRVVFERGAVVAAGSPLASDAAVRVALTGHLVSSSQVAEIARRQAAEPHRDEIDVIAQLARLGPEHARRLRRRVIAQRAARTFSIDRGAFVVTDQVELPVLPGCELDVRAVIYLGARANLSEQRLAAELDQLGAWFRTKPSLAVDLPQFGFTDLEQPVLDRLRIGGTIEELEASTLTTADARTVRAVVYAVAVCNGCDIEARARAAAPPTLPPPAPTDSRSSARAPRASLDDRSADRLPPTAAARREPTSERFRRETPSTAELPGERIARITPTSELTPMRLGRIAVSTTDRPGERIARITPASELTPDRLPRVALASSEQTADRPPGVAPGSSRPTLGPTDTAPERRSHASSRAPQGGGADGSDPAQRPPPDDGGPRRGPDPGQHDDARPAGGAYASHRSAGAVQPPRDGASSGIRPPGDLGRDRDGSSSGTRPPGDLGRDRDGSSSGTRPPGDLGRDRDASSSGTRPPGDLGRDRDGSSSGTRPPGDLGRDRGGSSSGTRPPGDLGRDRGGASTGTRPPGDLGRDRGGASTGTRPPGDLGRDRDGASSGTRAPGDRGRDRDGASSGIHLPGDRGGASSGTRPPGDRDDSSSGIRLPGDLDRDASSSGIRLPGDLDRDASSSGIRPPGDRDRDARGGPPPDGPPPAPRPPRTPSSSPPPRSPHDAAEATPVDAVIVRVPSARRPQRPRQIARADSARSHDVKALIGQRLKLLDQGADHFALLGVERDVSSDNLRKAYFALARQLHPDRLAALGISDDGKHAQRLFAQINTGFAVLSDRTRRASYVSVLRRGGDTAVRAEQARAEELARRILDAEDAFRRGELALRRDQPQAAVTELQVAVQLNPDEPDYHALLAWARFCAAPDKPAIAAATRRVLDDAIQRAPRAVAARFFLGRVERMLGRDQEALRHFREVVSVAPGHADAAAEIRALEARLSPGDKPGGGLFGRAKR